MHESAFATIVPVVITEESAWFRPSRQVGVRNMHASDRMVANGTEAHARTWSQSGKQH